MESLLHSQEQAVRGIGLYVNADKTEFLCVKQDETISTISGKPLKLVDQFTHFGSNISSTEIDDNICIGKTWTAIDWLLIIWKSDLSDIIKQDFFQVVGWLGFYGISTFVGYSMPNPFL